MEGTLSNTALARKMLIEFWSDCRPHSVREFRVYLQQNNMVSVELTHTSSAVYTACQQDVLERVGRGVYKAGRNWNRNAEAPAKRIGGVTYVLRQTKNVLAIPINVMELSQKERELIPRLQDLYQECEKMLDELEKEEAENEMSE